LYLDTAEPPVSAAALADQTGSTYQRASLNGLSRRGPTLVLTLEELDLTLDEELITEELERTLEELTTEEELGRMLEELTTEELERTLEELSMIEDEDELERMELTTELELERGQLAPPPTTPYGAG
jgi:hypothetical protein